MIDRFKSYIADKTRKLVTLVEVPGSLSARIAGCYFGLYEMVSNLERMGITPNTILDIGANRGMFTRCAHRVFPNSKIHAFEPLTECWEDLDKLKDTIPGLITHHLAVGSISGQGLINRNSYDYSSSLLEMEDLHKTSFPYASDVSVEPTTVERLDAILSVSELLRPVLMKLDVQGYEGEVLDGAIRTLACTDVIICELSLRQLYKGQKTFNEMFDEIRAAGFRFAGQVGELRNFKTREVLQIDGLFIKTDRAKV